MADNRHVDPSQRRDQSDSEANTQRSTRPFGVGLAVVALIAILAGVLSSVAPDAFQSVGGWVTPIVLMALTVVVVVTLMMMRLNQHNRRDSGGTPRSSDG